MELEQGHGTLFDQALANAELGDQTSKQARSTKLWTEVRVYALNLTELQYAELYCPNTAQNIDRPGSHLSSQIERYRTPDTEEAD